jgi:uncharacterized protein YndB with AHSA1/START domain
MRGVGTVVVIGAVVLLWGASLPRTTTAERITEIPAPVPEVYRLVTDIKGQAAWRSDIGRIEASRSEKEWAEHARDGSTLSFRVLRQEPNRLFVIAYSSPRGFEGRWTGSFEPTPQGTRVRFIETVTIPNPVMRAVARVAAPAGSHFDLYLSDLKRAAQP